MAISILRTIILYAALMVSMRIMGKRQLGELEPAELVVAVLISDLASHPLQDIGTPLIYGLVPVITLLCCELLLAAGVIRSVRFRSLVCGRPSVIIERGRIVQSEMKKNRFTLDELAEELRKKGITDISTVQYAVMETDGSLSTLLYPSEAAVTPRQLGLDAGDAGYPVILINEGRLMSDNLKKTGYNVAWLRKQLAQRSAKSERDVYLMTVDRAGNIYFEGKEKA